MIWWLEPVAFAVAALGGSWLCASYEVAREMPECARTARVFGWIGYLASAAIFVWMVRL